ncbi:hypothetical protein [Anaeromyxobacter oryzisoli]|uniref:hypothetical protein n=1 Tax=Anaeromyxobacter oryzisoli TaxID=2925408 RepID=UPI001F578E48|nr:hypothetical protein [Anaeromyxobacter sp. SG63]
MKPFTILGYSANDEVFCPGCLRATTGLAPSDVDYNGRPILPLYAADSSVQEECCTYCGVSLLELRLVGDAERARSAPELHVEKTRHRGRQPALRFDRKPPANILRDLKDAGWRWDPAAGLWWWPKGAPVPVPPSLGLPLPRLGIAARAPIVRKRALVAASA